MRVTPYFLAAKAHSHTLFALLALLLAASCKSFPTSDAYRVYGPAHPQEARLRDVGNDALDIVNVSLEFPALGAKATISGVEIGVFANGNDSHVLGFSAVGVGLRSGYFHYESRESVFIASVSGTFSGTSGDTERKQNQNYKAGRLGGAAGACLGIRAELNWLELVDFVAGIFGADFLEDDSCRGFPDPGKVKELNLSLGPISELPAALHLFPNLVKLKIRHAGLTEFPDEVESMTSLIHLDLSGNAIRALPAFSQKNSSLKTLDMKYNRLTSAGRELCVFENLEELDLSENHLERFPEIECLKKLKRIYLKGNQGIASVPPEIRQRGLYLDI